MDLWICCFHVYFHVHMSPKAEPTPPIFYPWKNIKNQILILLFDWLGIEVGMARGSKSGGLAPGAPEFLILPRAIPSSIPIPSKIQIWFLFFPRVVDLGVGSGFGEWAYDHIGPWVTGLKMFEAHTLSINEAYDLITKCWWFGENLVNNLRQRAAIGLKQIGPQIQQILWMPAHCGWNSECILRQNFLPKLCWRHKLVWRHKHFWRHDNHKATQAWWEVGWYGGNPLSK